jgi:predicted nucleotidyltransferase
MYLREFTQQEDVVDTAVQFHKELNPKLWSGMVMKPLIRYKLLQIAKDFIKFIDVPDINLVDITISGSNAAFSYTPQSDIDLHLVVDIPEEKEFIYKPLYDAKKNQYNFNHDIKIKGIDVEVYVQDSDDKHHSLGIYSVLKDKWVKKPIMGTVKIDDTDVEDKVNNYLNKIMQALMSTDLAIAQSVKEELVKLRKSGLERNGEFSVENVAFKVLRAKGFIEQLRQHIYKLKDKTLSLETKSETK